MWADLTLFLTILARMTGFVAMNPILGRTGIPGIFKSGMSLLLAVTAYGMTAERPAAYTAKDCGVPLRAEHTAHRKKKETHVAQVTASFGGKSVLHRGRLAEDKLSPATAESAAAARAAGWM